MKVFLDTTVIIEIERRNEEVIRLMKALIDAGHEILVSTITVSEILTGSYLRKDFKKASESAKNVLGQFVWVDFDAETADKTGQYLAYLIAEGAIIEYQDTAIAATFKIADADYLLTLNKAHFERLPELKGKVLSPKELGKIMK